MEQLPRPPSSSLPQTYTSMPQEWPMGGTSTFKQRDSGESGVAEAASIANDHGTGGNSLFDLVLLRISIALDHSAIAPFDDWIKTLLNSRSMATRELDEKSQTAVAGKNTVPTYLVRMRWICGLVGFACVSPATAAYGWLRAHDLPSPPLPFHARQYQQDSFYRYTSDRLYIRPPNQKRLTGSREEPHTGTRRVYCTPQQVTTVHVTVVDDYIASVPVLRRAWRGLPQHELVIWIQHPNVYIRRRNQNARAEPEDYNQPTREWIPDAAIETFSGLPEPSDDDGD
ncbi:hypothetical protein PG985_010224 [Apiospora marii]|uniref:Uncharacterized protein n=1 Tax=Apiospora marii TaxID=335849 RepID=A0ABR1RL98_9PEZI